MRISRKRPPHIRLIVQSEKLVFSFLLLLNITAILVVFLTDTYLGDAIGDVASTGILEKGLIAGGVLLSYLAARQLIPYKDAPQEREVSKPAIEGISTVLAVGIILGGIGFVGFDYGVAEKQSNVAFGFIFKLLPYDAAFTLLLCVMPFTKKYVALVAAYSVLRLAMGWTGFLASLFFIVMMRVYGLKERSLPVFFMTLGIITALFFFAPYVYAIKFLVRYGDWLDIGYVPSLAILLGRFTAFGNALYVSSNAQEVIDATQKYSSVLIPFIDPLLAMLPRASLGLTMENFETTLVYVIAGDFNPGIVYYLTAFGKLAVLWTANPVLALLWIAEAAVLLRVLFILTIKLCGPKGRYACLLAACGFALSGSLEEIGLGIYGLSVLHFFRLLMTTSRRRPSNVPPKVAHAS